MQPKRSLESYIHITTLHSLIEANWLRVNFQVRDYETTEMTLSAPNEDGVITIRYDLVPDSITIKNY